MFGKTTRNLADDARYTPQYKDFYAKRKETIERVFADAKEKHGMRYTLYRGLAQVSKWVRLKFAAMNLNNLARWKAKQLSRPSFLLFSALCIFYALRPARVFPRQAAFRRAGRFSFEERRFLCPEPMLTMPWFCDSYLGSMVNRLPLQNPVLLLLDAIQRKEVTQMKPNYSHTYQSCVFSMKRESAPWRVASGCANMSACSPVGTMSCQTRPCASPTRPMFRRQSIDGM